MKIQLSLTSKSCLDKVGNFDLMERGEIFVKGKGAMKTYWLLGEDGRLHVGLKTGCARDTNFLQGTRILRICVIDLSMGLTTRSRKRTMRMTTCPNKDRPVLSFVPVLFAFSCSELCYSDVSKIP